MPSPGAREGFAGVTVIDDNTDPVAMVCAITVKGDVLLIEANAAVMVIVPSETAVANPDLSIFALLVSDEIQVTEFEISCVVLSAYFPMAVNCWLAPTRMDELTGNTAIDVNKDPFAFVIPDPEHPTTINSDRLHAIAGHNLILLAITTPS